MSELVSPQHYDSLCNLGAPAVNLLRTPGVKNIENAYSNAGATTTHTPAYGGTRMG